MANLTRTNWPAGWLPSNDAVNGDPNGLLRMDNLRIDKTGVLGLIDGQQKVAGTASGYYSAFFSKVILGTEYVWNTTGDPPNSVRRTQLAPLTGGADLEIPDGGQPTNLASFGDAYGYTLCCAGKMRVKDPVFTAVKPLGLLTPADTITDPDNPQGPLVVANSQTNITIPCPTLLVIGDGTAPQVTLFQGNFILGEMCTQTAFNLDTTSIGSGPATDPGTDTISFPFTVVDQPAQAIQYVVCDFILAGDPSKPPTYTDYYEMYFDFSNLQSGQNTQTTLSMKRSELTRYGTDLTKTWKNVIGVRFFVAATIVCTCQFGDISIVGGADGSLNGVYNYVQADIDDDGHYVAISPISPQAVDGTGNVNITSINGSVTIHPLVMNPYATAHRFYRKAVSSLGVDPNTGLSLNNSTLGQYNFVGQSPYRAPFKDTASDTDILELNADGTLLPKLFLQTLNSQDVLNPVSDDILAIEGLYNERMLYMTSSEVELSDRLNPDAVDIRYTIKPSGDPGEKNLWLKKLTNNVLILATTKDLYEISGTLLDLPDGTLDVNVRSIGEAFAPLSRDVCHLDNGLYYIAADGLRVTTGSNSINVSPQLRPMFQNSILAGAVRTVAVHGVPTVAIYDGSEVNYSIAGVRGRVYFSLPCIDGSRRLYVFDTVTKTYSLMFTDPAKIYATQGGEIFASYGDGTAWFLDSIPGYGLNNAQGLQFKLRTVFDSNQQPRNRKDTFTLKLVMDTGGSNVSVDIQKNGVGVTEIDEPTWVNLGHYSASGQTTIYIPLSADLVTLGFRYALQLSDVNGVFTFKLYEATIEYEPRPEQLDYMRILPTNMGTVSRKRWTTFAFVIDTLGNPITFAPYLDNIAWSVTGSVNNPTKLTYIFYFQSEAIATDIGGILSGGVFEFYGLNLEECVSEKLPHPCEFLVIPPNNYGTPNRKRHTSYKFQLLSRGGRVLFTPIVDTVAHAPTTYNTATKQTVDYFFPESDGDVIGIDIGGTLLSLDTIPFEYYGTIVPQTVETLPDRLRYYVIPNNNFGVASWKRVRVLPMTIDTRGNNVTFTPVVDGSQGSPTIFNTNRKETVFYYFTTDAFGIDFGGILDSPLGAFEFYGMGTPEDVEVLPVPRKYDQLGPQRFDKIGKFFGFRTRLIATGGTTTIPFSVFGDNSGTFSTYSNPQYTGSFVVVPGFDNVVEVQFPKNINTDIFRLTLGPTNDPFFRYDIMVKVQISGLPGQSKWLPLR